MAKFCFKASKTATQTVEMVHTAYGGEAVTQSNIFRWYGQFREGQEDVQGNPMSGHPSDGWQNQKMFGSCCCKIVTYHFE